MFDERFSLQKLKFPSKYYKSFHLQNSLARSYLRTASPPISLYLRDSHWAIAQRPLVATFSAYN